MDGRIVPANSNAQKLADLRIGEAAIASIMPDLDTMMDTAVREGSLRIQSRTLCAG